MNSDIPITYYVASQQQTVNEHN